MFHRYPTAIDQEKQKLPELLLNSYLSQAMPNLRYGGFDGTILGNMALTFNFTIVIVGSKEEYGYRIRNGSFVGSYVI